jgi:hypothetical protein
MHCWASHIICAFYVCVQDIRNGNCRGLVRAILGEAVVLVYDNWVSDRVHVYVMEGYFRYRTYSTLPCFDPNTII